MCGSAYGATNYAANAGSGAVALGSLTDADGVFYLGSAVRIADSADGISRTAAFGERALGPGGTAMCIPRRSILQRPAGSDPTTAGCDSAAGDWFAERRRVGFHERPVTKGADDGSQPPRRRRERARL